MTLMTIQMNRLIDIVINLEGIIVYNFYKLNYKKCIQLYLIILITISIK